MGNATGTENASGKPFVSTDAYIATVRDLCREVPTLSPTDSLAHAVEILRLTSLGCLPLVSGGRLLALVDETDLARIILSQDENSRIRISPLHIFLPALAAVEVTGVLVTLHEDTPLSAAAGIFRERPEISLLPVLDDRGLYRGVVTRTDLLAARCKTLAPARVGGMATPLGVYLTDGVESGGAGNAGLVLTGVSVASLYFGGLVIAAFLLAGVHRWAHIDLNMWMFNFVARHGLSPALFGDLRAAIAYPFMLILLRLIPISGYHAAEHQVVHCIERGEPLVPQKVAQMPRPHPRCGTNLVAAVLVLFVSLSAFLMWSQDLRVALIVALITTLALWRTVGTFLQQYLTTRPASERQIASGIRAGEEILAKYRRRVERQGRLGLRIWRMGLLQIMAGGLLVTGIIMILIALFPALGTFLGDF